MRALLSAPGSRRVALCVAALLAGAALIAILRASSSPRVGLQLAGLMLALLAVGTLARRPRFPRLCAFPLPFWISPTVCIAVVVTASLLDLNGSSSAMLSRYIDRAPPTLGIVAGSPKAIRSDEWSVHTPWILSQIHQHPPFPLRNVAVGAGYATLLCNLPVAHWTALFRPEMWAFLARACGADRSCRGRHRAHFSPGVFRQHQSRNAARGRVAPEAEGQRRCPSRPIWKNFTDRLPRRRHDFGLPFCDSRKIGERLLRQDRIAKVTALLASRTFRSRRRPPKAQPEKETGQVKS